MPKLWGFLHHIAIRTYLIVMCCGIVPIFAAFGMIQRQNVEYIQTQLSQQIISSIDKSEEAVYGCFRDMAGIASAIVTDPQLVDGLQNRNSTYYAINARFDECVNYTRVNNLFASEEYMLTMFDNQGRCYANWNLNWHDYSQVLQLPWVQRAYQEKGHLVWELFTPSFVLGQQDAKYISVARAIPDLSGEDILGVLIVAMPQEKLSEILADYCFAEDDSVFVCGDGGTAILEYVPRNRVTDEEVLAAYRMRAGKDAGHLRMNTRRGDTLVSYYTLDTPWTMGEETLRIFHFTNFQAVTGGMEAFSQRINAMIILMLLAAMVIIAIVARLLVRPIRQLSDVMRHYQLGDTLAGIDMRRKDEMGMLNRSFQDLTVHVQELFSNVEREFRAREKYRYDSLRAQLNPHFLFNTLSTLRYLSIMNHADGITEGIDALASVLKYSMSRDGDWVRLADEVEHVKAYIAIQNMRFGSWIKTETDFEEETLRLYTLRFILQPIVENAVIHGFKEKKQNCLIRLYGHVEGEYLHLYVEDNGSGIPAQMLDEINQGRRPGEKMTGIGLSNIQEIIALTFGEAYTVEVESGTNRGTVVHYRLPVLPEARGGNIHEKSADR